MRGRAAKRRQVMRKKALLELLREHYGVQSLPEGVIVSAKGRWRLTNAVAAELSRRMKGVRSIGIALTGEDPLILTIEGAQLLGNRIKENVIELDEVQALQWLRGEKVRLRQSPAAKYVAVKSGKDWLGGGRADGKTAVADLPPWRRLKELPVEEKEREL